MMRVALIAGFVGLCVQTAESKEPLSFVDGSYDFILRAHHGQPTIMHFWGLTCGPCRLEMAKWGALLKERQGFDFVTVDTDMVPTAPGQAAAFLSNAGIPPSEAWRFDDGFAEKLYFQVDPQWQGEIPMTVLIGRDGRTERLVGAADLSTVNRWLDDQTHAVENHCAWSEKK